MKIPGLIGVASAILLATPLAPAQIGTAPVIGDNMVLQRDAVVRIWGSARPYEAITLDFQTQHLRALADALGHWSVSLAPLAASSIPAPMRIHGRRDTLVLNNIVVGEVWLVSGQSNMEFPMVGFPQLGVHLAAPLQHRLDTDLSKPDCDNLRLFHMKLDGDQPVGKSGGWTPCNSTTLASFSAVGYYFAEELQKRLGVPVGILEAAVGGTRIEPWTPPLTRGVNLANSPSPQPTDPPDAGTLFTKLIQPLAPYALRGVLWYQGEANVLAPGADRYAMKMRDLIQGWRSAWNDCDLPFEYALLAPMRYTLLAVPGLSLTDQTLPEFWEQQEDALSMPHTGLISTNDLVDLAPPAPGQKPLPYVMDLIHPGDKWDVAHRYLLLALTQVYGVRDIVSSGPAVRRVSRDAAGLKVDFTRDGSTLVSRDGKPLTGFEIAGPDLNFFPAVAHIDGESVFVLAPQVAQPVAVRFGWSETSQPNLVNRNQLPALPFRRTLSLPNGP